MTRLWIAWQVLRGRVIQMSYEGDKRGQRLTLTFVPTAEWKRRMSR